MTVSLSFSILSIQGIPNNLMPFIAQVCVGRREKLSIFGNDYDTPDGTGVRDYIHVVDLVQGHISALQKLQENPGVMTHNLGTGQGYSVLDLVREFSKVAGNDLPYRIAARRAGDAPAVFADPALAEAELGWKAKRGLDEMCADALRWQRKNPRGY